MKFPRGLPMIGLPTMASPPMTGQPPIPPMMGRPPIPPMMGRPPMIRRPPPKHYSIIKTLILILIIILIGFCVFYILRLFACYAYESD